MKFYYQPNNFYRISTGISYHYNVIHRLNGSKYVSNVVAEKIEYLELKQSGAQDLRDLMVNKGHFHVGHICSEKSCCEPGYG